MSKYKIMISDSLDVSAKTILESKAEVMDRAGISAEEILSEIKEYDALIVRGRTKVTKDLFNAATQLKVVGRAGVGVDNIDLAAAKEKGIIVVNSPTATSNAVAEHTLSLMLALVRKVPQGDASIKAGKWEKKALQGIELSGKTLGIIGMGRIGARVAEIAKIFDMQIIGYDPFLSDETIQARFAEPVKLEHIFEHSDLISLHLPLTPETKNLLDDEAFSRMKNGVRLICAARGGIINEVALLEALNSGKIAGAALDVFANEPPGLTDLVSHRNVVATPHIGAQTAEAQVRAAKDIAEEILNALEDKPLRWQVA